MRKALRYIVLFLAVIWRSPVWAENVVVDVTNFSELKSALNNATADKTIVLQNDIKVSEDYRPMLTGKSVIIDGNHHGITSSRNFALVFGHKGNLVLKNIGQVDKDYNIISSFSNNSDVGWGGPITTRNNAGTPVYDENSKIILENSVFSNNYAETDGGVLGLQTLDFDVQNSVFINNSSGQEGGVIWAEVNHGNIENSYFKGNFVRAQGLNTSIGGAIAQYGYYAGRPSYINNISGTFIENYSYNFGGAIVNRAYRSAVEINKINGDFSANYAIQIGGAILNAAGTINTIEGTFIKNYLLNTSTSTATVKNSTLLQNNSFGGAIANAGTGGNEAKNDGYIKSISGDFIGNFINTKNGNAYGGAIYNTGIIEDISGTFEDNYVFSEGTSENLALGGAIYSTKDLTITSGKSGTLFSGNYTLQNIGERNYNAIYMASSSATLNLTPKSGKTIQFDDNIDGVEGYKVKIESEYGGTLKLYNDIKNANVTTNDVNIDFVDSKYHNYEFLSLNSSETTNYAIDFKLDKSNMQSDTITTTNASSGYVSLSNIHFIADKTDRAAEYYNGTYQKQILYNNGGGNLQLVLGENLKQTQHKIISTAINDTINPITNASDKYYKNIYTGDLSSSIELATTASTNDSIKLTITELVWSNDVQKESLGDTFALWLGLETEEIKEFHLAANEQYKINETLNTASKGKLSVIGRSNISSVIDVNNKALFDVSKKSDLMLKNVRIISAVSDRGSVVKAINPNSSVIIDNASFLNNIAAAFGGVLFNASTNNANTINGIFNANMAGSSGGAIYNLGNIDSIKGEFSLNHTTNSWATGKVVGGAIANKGGTIKSITADFNSNYSDQYGGAIANFGENGVSPTINSISGNFNNNYIVVNNSEAFGGAIYNNKKISSITGNFIGNHIAQDNLDKVVAKGGAIYNEGTNGLVISGNFLDNYISVNSSSSALGGAIYTKMNTSIVADNGQNTLFKGNYVQIGNNKNDNAIYVDNINATLTLNASNYGVISLYDNIDGAVLIKTDEEGNETGREYYKVLITGDNTGVVGLYNDIKNADVQAGKASISLVDGITKNYTFNSLKTEAETSNIAKWNIDVDLTNGKADTITTADSSSKGTILINNFNIMGVASQDNLVIQVLKNTTGNNNLQLKIADGVLKVVTDVRAIGNEVFSSKSYLKQDAGISLATKTTTNDSIKFLKDGFYDALQLINQKETSDERKFTFDTAGTHSLLENLGETKSGTLSINGYSNDSSVSVIDLAGKTGFELANGNTTINLNNATLTDSTSASTNPVIQVTSANNIINLNNAQLKGNIASDTEYKLNLLGSNVGIYGTVDKANATLDNAQTTLTFNTDTFANASLSADQGTINLQDSAINIYNIGTLKSDINTLYNIDVDAFNKTSDTIKAGENSNGRIKIGSINFLNGITPQDKNFKVQILDPASNLTLSLSDAIVSQLYDFGQVTDTVKDTINTKVNFDDRFYKSVKDFVIKGHLSVLDDNKSIGFKDKDMQKVAIAVKEQELLDSLHELSNLNASEKEFKFKTADDVYGVMTNIGTVVNDLTIKGVADSSNNKLSVIGIDNNKGFILNSGSTLNISNVNLRGTNSVITNNGGTLNFNNKNIVNGKMDGTGTATNNGDLYIGASNIGLTIDNQNKLYLSEGTLNKTITGSGETIINSGILTLGANAKVEGTLNLNGGKMSAVDNNYTEYHINNLVSNGGSYSLDVDLANKTADTINVASGSGTITLDNLNITGSISNPTADYKIQILKLTDTSSSLQLALSASLSSTLSTKYELSRTNGSDISYDTISANTSWDTEYRKYEKAYDLVTYGKLGLATTTTTNDSIGMNVTERDVKTYTSSSTTKQGDTLKLVNQDTTNATKNFTTTSATATYNVTEALGTTKGTLNIKGATAENGTKSTVNLNSKGGFALDDTSTALNLDNVKLEGNNTALITATTSKATIGIKDSIIAGNIQGAGNNISISGTGTTTLNGVITNANTKLTSGTLVFGTETFKNSGDTLTVIGGNVNLKDNAINEYNINNLVSNGGSYSLDVDLTDETADTINVASGSGTITLDSLNIIKGAITSLQNGDTIEIIKGASNINLALSDALQQKNLVSSVLTSDLMSTDTILATTLWNNKYYEHYKDYTKKTYIQLATSGGNIVANEIVDEKDITPRDVLLGDTLKLVNQDTTNATKNFTTTSASATYNVTEALGTTKGTLNIKGATAENGTKSTIDLKANSGFALDDTSTALNLENVKVTGNNTALITATTSKATIGITDSIIAGNIQGAGNIINFSGVSELKGNITNSTESANMITNSGTLTANGTISGKVTNNTNGTLTANGAITGDVENSGTFYANSSVNGKVTNSGNLTVSNTGSISGNVTNNTNSTLTSAIGNLQGTLTNNGTYYMTGANVTLDKEIAGAGTTVLEQSAILQFGGNGKIAGTLDLNNGIINMQEKDGETVAYNEVSIGKLTGTGSLKIDIDLKDGYSDKLNLSGNGNDGKLTLTSINVRKDGKVETLSYLTGETSGLDLALGTNSDLVSTVTNDYTYAFTLSGGVLTVVRKDVNTKPNTLKDFITGQLAIPVKTYSMTGDITITAAEGEDFGTTTGTNNELNLNLNRHTLSGTLSGVKKDGIVVNRGDQLNISGDNGNISGFNTAITVRNGGKLEINEVKLSDNTTDINNSGKLEASDVDAVNIINAENGSATIQNSKITGLNNDGQAYLRGVNEITNIASNDGKGTLNISTGTTTVSGSLKQEKVSVAEGATLTTALSNYAVNSTQNNGTLSLTGDGTVSQNISGENGHLELNGTVTNNAKIEQAVNVAAAGELTINANIGNLSNSGEVIANTENLTGSINNLGTLKLSGTLDKTITGSGTTTVNDTLTLGTNAKISGTLNLNDKSISTSDGSYTNYAINSITGSGNAKIDVDWANQKADTFQSTSGDGTLSLSLIQTSTADIFETKSIQITSGGVGISLAETTGTKTKTETGSDYLVASVDWTDKFGGWRRTDTYSEKISAISSLGTSVLDTIQYKVERINEGDKSYTANLDTLSLIVKNSVTGSDTKTFTTNSSTTTYNVTADLGTLRDNLVISGTIAESNISTINIGNHQGITISGNNSLTLKDVKVTSAGTVVNAESNNAQTTLDNAQIEGNIVNSGDLNLKGNTSATNISGTGSTVVDTLANAQISSLTQDTLSNSGNLTLDKLAISTSAENNGTLTNNGTSSINALTNNTGATINGNGSLTLSGTSSNKGSITQKNLIISGMASSGISTYALRSRVATAGSFINSGTLTAENIENNGDIDNTLGTLIGKLTNNGTISGGNITAKDGTINTGSITSANLSVEKGFDNQGNVSGTINISNSGNLVNNGSISGAVTNGGVLTSSLDTINGIIVNNGTFKATGGTLNTAVTGTGTTKIEGNVNINNGSFSTLQNVSVSENASLNIGSKTLDINNFTLNGTLDIAITNLVKNSSVYAGGQVLVNNADLSGGKLSFTVASGVLNKGEKTGDLSVIKLKPGATGSINGDVSALFETNNRYEIQQGSSLGTIIIKNKASGAEVASQIGNQNNRNTADAWDKVEFASNTPASKVQEVLNTLSQHNKEGYRQALNQVAPSDSQFKLETTRMVQNIISKETTHRFEEEGCTCGEVFKRSSMWMQTIGGYNKQSDSFEHQGFKSHTTGYILGYDGSINCGTSLGFGYAYAKSKGKSHSKDMNISSHNLFVYGKYQPLFSYVRGALLYGLADNREKTSIGKYGVSSDYDTHYIGAETYVGYEYLNGITPEMGVRYTYLMPDDYTDSLGQKVKNKDVSALTLATRLNYEKKFKLDNGIHVKPEIYAGITYDLNDTGTSSNVTLGTETYSIRAYRVSRFGTEAGIKMSISKDKTDVILGYDTSIKKGYTEHTGMLKLRYNF